MRKYRLVKEEGKEPPVRTHTGHQAKKSLLNSAMFDSSIVGYRKGKKIKIVSGMERTK
jgi:hypothetical protein